MGGGFFYILWKHLAPNFVSSIMFMVVMNIRSGIVTESTLSFMGIGLPLEILSWGSMLSLSERALLGASGG
jgi:peptide/nickel transport system permease protein